MTDAGPETRAMKRRKTAMASLPSIMASSSAFDSVSSSASASNAAAVPRPSSLVSNDSHWSDEPREAITVATQHTQQRTAEDDLAATASATDNQSDSTTVTVAVDGTTQPGAQSSWPAQGVPVEIFNLIVQFLPRGEVKKMRLVNREFDDKLAEIYFKTVVVPFRPEFEALYGSLNINPSRGGDQKLSLVMNKKKGDDKSVADDIPHVSGHAPSEDSSLLSAGHRVFQQFGDKMRKFALALELNEQDLAFPPLKLNQEIVSAPWGLYRWPIMNYQRYTEVEGLEQMADETGYMKRAFQFLEFVRDIGISCDAGLGWLQGPDINPLCAPTGHAVFRPNAYGDAADANGATAEEDAKSSLSLSILKQMVLNAGFSTCEWPRVVLRLLQDEGREGAIAWRDRTAPDGKLVHERVPKLAIDNDTPKEAIIAHIESVIERDSEGAVASSTDARPLGLTPTNLTPAQAEMLLELEWAHRALMQSYRIAVMDNKDSFKNLTKLTIARCPGCHVLTWCNDSFWETMTSIETFHLGVIPDWREITKDATGVVIQRRVNPINVCQNVFRLLSDYVGEQENVKNFSFEWICGGEFAIGKSQRDRYILPAPVLSDANKMADVHYTFGEEDILNMPYVEKLSLKNSWFTPHVFLNFFRHMSMEAVVEVNLESVSLTGPPSATPELSIYPASQLKPIHWPWPLCVGAEPGHWFSLQRPQNAANNPPWNQWAALQAFGNQPAAPGWQQMPALPNPNNNLNPAGVNPFVFPPFLAGANFPAAANFGVPNPAGANAANPVNAAGAIHPGLLQGPGQAAHPHHNHIMQAVVLNTDSPMPNPENPNPNPNSWRSWSWAHVLASLRMSMAAVEQHKENDTEGDRAHRHAVQEDERQFSHRFRKVFCDRDNKHNAQVFKLKSCGYALIDTPHIDNWKIIPEVSEYVYHREDLVARLRELDNQMLISQEGLLGKVLNYMPRIETRHLYDVFGLEFGWQNLYDPIVARVAVADGNPQPGRARFHGCVDNDPDSITEQEKLSSKGKTVTS